MDFKFTTCFGGGDCGDPSEAQNPNDITLEGGEKETITVPISDLQGGEIYYLHLRADPLSNCKGEGPATSRILYEISKSC